MASKQEILETLSMLAGVATTAAETALAEDINALIAKHGGKTATAPAAPAAAIAKDPTDDVEIADAPEAEDDHELVAPVEERELTDRERADQIANTVGVDDNNADTFDPAVVEPQMRARIEEATGMPIAARDAVDDDPMAGLAAMINEIGADVERDATPRSMTLHIAGPDAATAELATEIAEGMLPAVIDVMGELTIGEIVVGDTSTTVQLDLTDDNDGVVLASMAGNLGIPVVEAHWQTSLTTTYVVTAIAAPPADIELARELGLAPPEDFELPEVPEGQHQINAVIDLAEEQLGFRPEAATVRITFSRGGYVNPETGLIDGIDATTAQLTNEQVQAIVAHPFTAAGLAQMGNLQLVDVEAGEAPYIKVAIFGILGAGRINPAAAALGAMAYRGSFNFGGDLGLIYANAETTLVDAHAQV